MGAPLLACATRSDDVRRPVHTASLYLCGLSVPPGLVRWGTHRPRPSREHRDVERKRSALIPYPDTRRLQDIESSDIERLLMQKKAWSGATPARWRPGAYSFTVNSNFPVAKSSQMDSVLRYPLTKSSRYEPSTE